MDQDRDVLRGKIERDCRHERLCFEAWWEGFKAALPTAVKTTQYDAKTFAEWVEQAYRKKHEELLRKIDALFAPLLKPEE